MFNHSSGKTLRPIAVGLIAVVALSACGDDKPSKQKTAEKILNDLTSDGSIDLSDISSAAEDFQNESTKGLPKPCSILTKKLVTEIYGGSPKETMNTEGDCVFDIEGEMNIGDGSSIVPPSISLRFRNSSAEDFNLSTQMLGYKSTDDGVGKMAAFSTVGGGIYTFLTNDNVIVDLQLVTVGSDIETDAVKSSLVELAKKVDSKL